MRTEEELGQQWILTDRQTDTNPYLVPLTCASRPQKKFSIKNSLI